MPETSNASLDATEARFRTTTKLGHDRLPEELSGMTMLDEATVFQRIDDTIQPFSAYRTAMDDLQTLPRGYALCFAFNYVQADILNGGISQLYANSTWCLIPDAVEAAHTAGLLKVAGLLKEIIYYYHSKGRSKLKRRIDDSYFSEMPADWDKSLSKLDDEFYDLATEYERVIPVLCSEHEELFQA